jgi:hypothetical protein
MVQAPSDRAVSLRGQVALSITFMIGTIVLVAGLMVAFLVISFLNSSYGFQASNRALALASGGVEDAMLQLLRNKDFSGTYCVPLAPCSAAVTVTQNSPSVGRVRITSSATVFLYTRQIEAVASLASSTGQLDLLTWRLL